MPKGLDSKQHHQLIEQIRARYANTATKELAEELGLSIGQIYYLADKLGIRKSPEFMRRPEKIQPFVNGGIATRFKKGMQPWNKGKKGVTGTHPNCRRTQFKKGQKPVSTVPVGSERIDKDGYLYIKVQDSPPKWKPKHVLLWEQQNGAVPKGYVVIFKDGNKMNLDLENLELITRQELMKRNTVHRLPPEIKQMVTAVSALRRKITIYGKKQNR